MMTQSVSLHHFVGLRLSEAQTLLREDAALSGLPQKVIETAPPQAPFRAQAPQRERATSRKSKTPDKAPRAPQRFGEWRVLNCKVQDENNARRLELIVAREELKPLPVEEASISQASAATETNL